MRLFNYDQPAQYQLLKKRIPREVTPCNDVDFMWDMVNEAIHCRVSGDWGDVFPKY